MWSLQGSSDWRAIEDSDQGVALRCGKPGPRKYLPIVLFAYRAPCIGRLERQLKVGKGFWFRHSVLLVSGSVYAKHAEKYCTQATKGVRVCMQVRRGRSKCVRHTESEPSAEEQLRRKCESSKT